MRWPRRIIRRCRSRRSLHPPWHLRRWRVARPRVLRRRCITAGWSLCSGRSHAHSRTTRRSHAHSRMARRAGRTRTPRTPAGWGGWSRSTSSWSRGRSGIVDELHKLRVAVSATLERRSVLDHEPKESSLHVSIAFSNHVDLRADIVGSTFAFSEGPNNCTKLCCKRIATGKDFDLLLQRS
jgi:hypothetical protein